jgi:hypothetical protein
MLSLPNLLRNLHFLSFLSGVVAAQYTAIPRWGQASALVNDVLFVYGGKTDQYNQYSYTSAPNNNDLLKLSLSTSFDLATPPWQYVAGSSNSSTSQGPPISWSSLSAYDTSHLLLFGGEPGPNSGTVLSTLPDSADILDVYDQINPQWTVEPQSWANEPARRMYHSASSTGGKIWITGGEKADGSNDAISDHEVFDPSIPTFTQLPSVNGPPDIYGHASIVLSNGSLIVFGGYTQSLASMNALSTIWLLDTTASNLQWTLLSVANTTLPTPRRGFAAALLETGMVIIHGGADATLETTYSDGWILDTTQNPMVWSAVPQLSQLGSRRDHLAVATGQGVLFAFGYGSNGPTPANLSLYDSSTGIWQNSFTPSAASPVNTLPPSPTNSITGSPSNTYPPGQSAGSPSGSDHPKSTGGGNSAGETNGSKHTAIALGSVFGVLSLVAVSVFAIYYIRRRHQQNATQFHMLGGFEDEEYPHQEGAIPTAGNVSHRLPLFGFIGRTAPIQRRDMLADEDTRYFNAPRREGSGGSSFNSFVRNEKPGFTVQSSLASLRSVGAMLVMGTTARGDRSRELSRSSKASPWDEKRLDPFSDEAALVPGETTALRWKGGRTRSWNSPPYVDPFSDKEIGEYHDGDSDAHSVNMEATLTDQPQRYLDTPTTTPELTPISPVMETVSHRSYGLHSSESLDLHLQNSLNTVTSSSHSSDEVPRSPGARRSSILDLNPLPNQPIRRSNSWWTRFAKTPFLDRRPSDGARSQRMVQFRDPNPPPRLGAIEERSVDSPHPSQPSRDSSVGSYHQRIYSTINHGRSVSSLQTAQTADSEALERISGMDIVQRDSTIGSRYGSGVDDPAARRPLSLLMSADRSDESHEARSSLSGGSGVSLPPMEVELLVPARAAIPYTLSSPTSVSGSGSRPSPVTRLSSGGLVSSRIQAFERRMSMDAEASKPPSPDERSTRNREVRVDGGRDRRAIKYGFAPKPSLFVANPDRKSSSSAS